VEGKVGALEIRNAAWEKRAGLLREAVEAMIEARTDEYSSPRVAQVLLARQNIWRKAQKVLAIAEKFACDECNGSGVYFISGEPQECICTESQIPEAPARESAGGEG
jgi:hypothetical protein